MIRTLLRRTTAPMRAFFNVRFENLAVSVDHLAQTTSAVVRDVTRSVEAVETHLGAAARQSSVDEVLAACEIVSEMARSVELAQRRLEALTDQVAIQISAVRSLRLDQVQAQIDPESVIPRLFDVTLDRLGPNTAILLNKGRLLNGIGEPSGLQINDGIALQYYPGGQRVASLNERLIENPFVFESLHGLATESSIVDIGSVESVLPLALAMRGHKVVALDPRGYAYTHPGLTAVDDTVAGWSGPDGQLAAITCVSAIEHFGIGFYSQAKSDGRADLAAMQTFKSWLAPDGVLVLTVPFGRQTIDDQQRVYDDAGISELMEGFTIRRREAYRRIDDLTWVPVDETPKGESWPDQRPGVLCLEAVPT